MITDPRSSLTETKSRRKEFSFQVEMPLIKLIAFLLKCTMGLYNLDLSYYLVTADNSSYDLRHANYQFKTRTDVLKFSYFFRVAKSWNSLPLNLIKTESLNDFKDLLKSFLNLRDISTFS